MKVFRRLTGFLIAVIFGIMSLTLCLAEEHYEWDCPECDRTGNTGNFCGQCGHPAPWLETSTPTPAPASSFEKFSVVSFGHYEQDNDSSNGPEPIEWIVLDHDEENNRVLLLSKYGLDTKPFNNKKYAVVPWDSCTLRTWLNGEFLNSAFSAEEQSAILVTDVDNSAAQGFSVWKKKGGKNTKDRIFLLSYAEANLYLDVDRENTKNVKARVAPTDYAIAQGAGINKSMKTEDGKPAGWWWLRSPGYGRDAAGVNVKGSLHGGNVNSNEAIVRPAFWLDLEAGMIQ